MGTSEDSTLTLFEHCKAEKREMAECTNRIIDILNGNNTTNTSIDREFTNFVEHLSNLKSFFSKDDQEVADARVNLVLACIKNLIIGWKIFADQIKEQLRQLMNLSVDYSKVPFEKLQGPLKPQGQEGAVSAES